MDEKEKDRWQEVFYRQAERDYPDPPAVVDCLTTCMREARSSEAVGAALTAALDADPALRDAVKAVMIRRIAAVAAGVGTLDLIEQGWMYDAVKGTLAPPAGWRPAGGVG
jgi:hypothetical protein